MFVYVQEHTFLLVCTESRRVSGVSSSSLSAYYFLRQGLSLTPGFTFSSIMLESAKLSDPASACTPSCSHREEGRRLDWSLGAGI